MKRQSRHRDWCFTAYAEIDIYDMEQVQYMIYQKEICPKTKREHFQGYIEMKTQFNLKQMKELFGDKTIHLGARLGTQQQAIDYCCKSESAVEGTLKMYGMKKRMGARSDLDAMVDMIESGMTGREILLETRGNGLRHISHIYRGLNAFHRVEAIDLLIEANRVVVLDDDVVG